LIKLKRDSRSERDLGGICQEGMGSPFYKKEKNDWDGEKMQQNVQKDQLRNEKRTNIGTT